MGEKSKAKYSQGRWLAKTKAAQRYQGARTPKGKLDSPRYKGELTGQENTTGETPILVDQAMSEVVGTTMKKTVVK